MNDPSNATQNDKIVAFPDAEERARRLRVEVERLARLPLNFPRQPVLDAAVRGGAAVTGPAASPAADRAMTSASRVSSGTGAPLVRTRTTLRLSDGWTNVPQSNTRNAPAVTAIRFRTNSTDMPVVTANRLARRGAEVRHA